MTEKIAIIIKTYLREEVLFELIHSIKKYSDLPYRLYIADESPISAKKLAFYEALTKEGHEFLLLDDEKPISVCYARNKLVSLLKDEKYVLRIDDDFHFSEHTKLANMKLILDSRPEIGAVSGLEVQGVDGKGIAAGEISAQQGYFFYDEQKKVIYKQPVPINMWHWRRVENIRYAYADFTRNFLLIRKEVFQSVQWNEALQLQGEHSDFMLQLKRSGWLLAFTPDSSHIHNEPPKAKVKKDYQSARNNELGKLKMDKVFQESWNIKAIKKLNIFIETDFISLIKSIIKLAIK